MSTVSPILTLKPKCTEKQMDAQKHLMQRQPQGGVAKRFLHNVMGSPSTALTQAG